MKLLLSFAVIAGLVNAEWSAICNGARIGTYCSGNGTYSCATEKLTTCPADHICQQQGAAIARCQPAVADLNHVCALASKSRSSVRCSKSVNNVRIACPSELISKCPVNKVCVEKGERFAQCEYPAGLVTAPVSSTISPYTTQFVVINSFTADVDPVTASTTKSVTETQVIPLTTSLSVTQTITTSPIITFGTGTDAGNPTTFMETTTEAFVTTKTISINPTTSVVMPTTMTSVDVDTIVSTIVQTITHTVPKPTDVVSTIISVTTEMPPVLTTEVLTLSMETTVVDASTFVITPIETQTESLTIATIIPLTSVILITASEVNTGTLSVTPAPTSNIVIITESVTPITTLATTSTVDTVVASSTPVVTVTPMFTATDVGFTVITETMISTDIFPVSSTLLNTEVETMTASMISTVPIIEVSTDISVSTPLVSIIETETMTYVPTVTEVLPSSIHSTQVYTTSFAESSYVPSVIEETRTSTQVDVNTLALTSTVLIPETSTHVTPTLITETFIVCHTPTPTVSEMVIETFDVTMTSPTIVVTETVATRTRGPGPVRLQTTIFPGSETSVSMEGSSESGSIPLFTFAQQGALQKPSYIKVEGACTTLYRIKYGFATSVAVATSTALLPYESLATQAGEVITIMTETTVATATATAALPITTVMTVPVADFTTIHSEAPVVTIVESAIPTLTVIDIATAEVSMTETTLFTNINVAPSTRVETVVDVFTQTEHIGSMVYATITEVDTAVIPTEVSTIVAPSVTIIASPTVKTLQTVYTVGAQSTVEIIEPTQFSTINVFPPPAQVTLTQTIEHHQTSSVTQHASTTPALLVPETQIIAQTLVSTKTYASLPSGAVRKHRRLAALRIETFSSTRSVTATNIGSTTLVDVNTPTVQTEPTRVYTITTTFTGLATATQTGTELVSRTSTFIPVHTTPVRQVTITSSTLHTQTVSMPDGGPSGAGEVSDSDSGSDLQITVSVSTTYSATVPSYPTTILGSGSAAGSISIDSGSNSAPIESSSTVIASATVSATVSSLIVASTTTSAPTVTVAPPVPAGHDSTCPSFSLDSSLYRLTAPGTQTQGAASCSAIGAGWTLADIAGTSEHALVGSAVCGVTYYESWEGNNYGGMCIAMYPGGATAVPPEGCYGNHQSLCKHQL